MSSGAGKAFWACAAGIVYVYAGYPATLWAATRLRKSEPTNAPAPSRPPSVTLVIAAFNEEDVISSKLENSLAIDYPDLEVIVVADGSTDRTAEVARQFESKGVTVLHHTERKGKAAALNRAVAQSRAEVVVFSDANNRFDAAAVRHLVAPFSDPQTGGTTGLKTVIDSGTGLGASEGLYWRYEAAIRSMESRLGSCTGANGEIMAMRRPDYSPIPEDVINDDLYLAMGVLGRGQRFLYVPDAVSRELPSESIDAEHERRARMTAGRFALLARPGFATQGGLQVTWQFFSHKVGRLVVPLFMVGAFVAAAVALRGAAQRSGLLALGGAHARRAVASQLGIYGLAALGVKRPTWLPYGFGAAGRAALYLVAGNVATVAGFVRFVRGRQSVLWDRVNRTT